MEIRFDNIRVQYNPNSSHRIDESLDKIIKTILSLETREQINTVLRMIDNFEMYHKTEALSMRLKDFAFDKLNIEQTERFYSKLKLT